MNDWRYRRRCQRCGRFFKSVRPYDEFCGHICYADDQAEKERWARMKAENEKALQSLQPGTRP